MFPFFQNFKAEPGLKCLQGFTLAELLIALAILGVMATFTIPKILAANAEQQKKAVFKETIAALSAITVDASQNLSVVRSDVKDFFRQRLNYTKIFSTNVLTEGCWSAAGNADAYLLANGAAITDINGGAIAQDRETIEIDWDGPLKGANTLGDDKLSLVLCFAATYCNTVRGASQAGAVGPNNGASIALWTSIFN